MPISTAPPAGQAGSGQQSTSRTLAGLAADDFGYSDSRPPLVLLHGLTFDRRMWGPSLSRLAGIDPGRRVLALDLPGHGASGSWPSYDMESLAQGVHRAVEAAQIEAPVVVGHSIGAIIATFYAARYPTACVINVDQPLQVAQFAGLVQSLDSKLRGPAFADTWQMFAASMHADLLGEAGQELVESSSRPQQELVLAYWRQVLDSPVSEIAELAASALAAIRSTAVPYVVISGADLGPEYKQWLSQALPEAEVIVWPGSGHFPHIAHPGRFASCLAGTAHRHLSGSGS
jgi:pimeloyl-ACP methyl ester carboxylesterase